MNPSHDDPNLTTPFATNTHSNGSPTPGGDERTEMGPRFHVLRPHARGGLGEVFVARDGELNREVALKEMRAELADNADSRARFLREAEITGGLEHPGIVPIYGLGQYADGRPFYAMRFVQGESLEEAIRRFHAAEQADRDPGERSLEMRRLLTRFVAVCEAVAYAHSRGVLHRDLKPANIMLGPYGETLVIDWGLAKSLGSQARSVSDAPSADSVSKAEVEDAAPTQAGAVLGTPAYMSPEQAAGQLDQLGPATDIYSLGGTLYCLLTGRAPYTGKDLHELQRRVQQGELMAPRQARSAVPHALEAICLKAMALRPEDRYASARALAEEVEQWLADEPVSAYREPLLARGRRWARRHRPLVAGLSALVLAVLILGGGGLGWWQWRQAVVEAAATEDLTRAEELLAREAPAAEVLQAMERAEGRLAGGGAERLRERARQMRKWIAFAGRLDQARQRAAGHTKEESVFADGDRAYADCFAAYGLDMAALPPQVSAERIRSSPIRTRLVAALDNWAHVKDRLAAGSGDPLRAIAQLADDDEWRRTLRDPDVRKDRARLESLAQRADALAQPPVSITLLAHALNAAASPSVRDHLLREAQHRYPNDFSINFDLGILSKRPEESVGFFRAALALQPRSEVTHTKLGIRLLDQGKWTEAETECRIALQIDPDYAWAHNLLGLVLERRGKPKEAEAEFRTALRFRPDMAEFHINLGANLHEQRKLTEAEAEERAALRIQPNCAEAHTNPGNVLREQGKLAEAEAEHRLAIRLKSDLAEAHYNLGRDLYSGSKLTEAEREFRTALRIKPDEAGVHGALGSALSAQGKHAEAEAEYRAALHLEPDNAPAHYNFGNHLRDQGKLKEAEAEYRTALRLKPDYAEAHHNFGKLLFEQGKYVEAEAGYRAVIRLKPGDAPAHADLGATLGRQNRLKEAETEYRTAIQIKPDYAEAHLGLGITFFILGQMKEAETEYRTAIQIKPDFADAHCNLGDVLRQQGRFAESLASYQRGHELGVKLPGWRGPSGQRVREARQLVDLDARFPRLLRGEIQPADAGERIEFAFFCCKYKQLMAAAARFYAGAFAEQPKLAEDLRAWHRYNAACAAALAAAGQGKDADKLDDRERARLRKQALDWLRADLTAWGERLNKEPDRVRAEVLARMKHWQQDADFASVRGDAVGKLPESERVSWRKLWDDVEALRRAAERK